MLSTFRRLSEKKRGRKTIISCGCILRAPRTLQAIALTPWARILVRFVHNQQKPTQKCCRYESSPELFLSILAVLCIALCTVQYPCVCEQSLASALSHAPSLRKYRTVMYVPFSDKAPTAVSFPKLPTSWNPRGGWISTSNIVVTLLESCSLEQGSPCTSRF